MLSRDASLERAARGEDSMSRYRCLRVTGPYEAAAELLCESPVALVVDLRCLSPNDLPLIEMARQRSLEILAVGSVPLGISTTDLSGSRLASRNDLSLLLEELVKSQPSEDSIEDSGKITSDASDASPPVRRTAKSSQTEDKIAETPAAKAKVDDDPPAISPNDLLTREELAALLEDGS
ncbi:MAG: hypothetical protein GY794_07260 [bacterium]|nr:hypothetical protein [bacterium]